MVIFHGELLNNQMVKPTGWGPRSIAFSCLKKVAELTMVYGRYNYSLWMLMGYYYQLISDVCWFMGLFHGL